MVRRSGHAETSVGDGRLVVVLTWVGETSLRDFVIYATGTFDLRDAYLRCVLLDTGMVLLVLTTVRHVGIEG